MQKNTENTRKNDPEGQNLQFWYDYGFEGAIEQAEAMERTEAVQFLTSEVVTFAKCDPNFARSGRAGDPSFIMNFSLYLCGRLDERRDQTQKIRSNGKVN